MLNFLKSDFTSTSSSYPSGYVERTFTQRPLNFEINKFIDVFQAMESEISKARKLVLGEKSSGYPKYEKILYKDKLEFHVYIPGLTNDDISLSLIEKEDNLFMVISGNKIKEKDKSGEILFSNITRKSFTLECLIDKNQIKQETIKASLKDGILYVSFERTKPEPIKEEPKSVKIDVPIS